VRWLFFLSKKIIAIYPQLSVQFLTGVNIINIYDGVYRLPFSGGSTLSSHDLNDILLHAATDRLGLSCCGPLCVTGNIYL